MKVLLWLYRSHINSKGLVPDMMRITINNKRINFPTQITIEEKTLELEQAKHQRQERTKELAEANETLSSLNKELHRSNANLEEFAHAASHDLKEPVRKIHYFTSELKLKLHDRIQE